MAGTGEGRGVATVRMVRVCVCACVCVCVRVWAGRWVWARARNTFGGCVRGVCAGALAHLFLVAGHGAARSVGGCVWCNGGMAVVRNFF